MFKRILDRLGIDLLGTAAAEVYNIEDVNQNDEVKQQLDQLGNEAPTYL